MLSRCWSYHPFWNTLLCFSQYLIGPVWPAFAVSSSSAHPSFIRVPQGSILKTLLPWTHELSLGVSIHTHVLDPMLVTSKLLPNPCVPSVYLVPWQNVLKASQTKTPSSPCPSLWGFVVLFFSKQHHSLHLSSSMARSLGQVIVRASSSSLPCNP